MKHQIIRIEDKQGYGMYHNLWDTAISCLFESTFDLNKHPEPYDDPLIQEQWCKIKKMNKELFYGFLDKEQYFEWVDNPLWRKSLTDFGGVLKTYEVDASDLIIGETQVIFIKDNAKLISENPPDIFDVESIQLKIA